MTSPDRPYTFIETPEQLAAFCADEFDSIDGAPIGLDIEEDREHRFLPSVALIQITVEDRDYILDPLTLPYPDLAAAIEFMCLTASEIVMHGCRNDVTGLKRDFGVGPRHVRDTQLAARFLGAGSFGLAALLSDRFDVTLNKAVRRSNWLRRPLTKEQLGYAREDTQYLLPLWDEISAQAIDAGWEDALLEECNALGALPVDTTTFDPLGWRRAKGSRQLEDEQKYVAAAIWQWRWETARELDLHPSRLLPPWAMIQIAKRGPRCVEEGNAKGVPKSLSDTHRQRLVDAITNAEPVSTRRAPTPRGKRAHVASEVLDARLSALLQWRTETSESTGLDPGFLAPRSILDAIARADVQAPDEYKNVPDIRQWRADRWGDVWFSLR